jgi:hypothetical protein
VTLTIKSELYPWITGAVIAWGLLDCFFGYRLFKITLAVLGGVIGCVLGQMLGASLGLGQGGQWACLIGGGLLGAALAFLLYVGAVFLAGFLFGATLSILLLANFNHMVALLSGGLIGLVTGFIAVKLQEALMKLSTALLGAFRAILATAYFANKTDWLYYVQHPEQVPALIDNTPWMFPSVLALAVVGAIAQFELGGKGGGKKKPKSD